MGGGYGRALRNSEFRALFAGQLASVVGDQLAKVALAYAVFDRTGSTLLTAAAYAATYLPWVVGGPVLAALADRMPRRRLLVLCDLARMALVASMALPGIPPVVLVGLLLVAELAAPPFDAARAAVLPDVLPDEDSYVAASALSTLTYEGGQLIGLLVGGVVVAAVGAQTAFLIDAATFGLSALLIWRGMRDRPAPERSEPTTLLADTLAGLRFVVRTPAVRALVLLGWVACAVTVVPEGMAVPYADALGGGPRAAGLLLAATPIGVVAGGVLVARVDTSRRTRLLAPLALLVPLPLVLCGLAPGLVVTAVLWACAGLGGAFMLVATPMLVAAVPDEMRGRVFGLAQSGLMASQGAAVLAVGVAGEQAGLPTVVSVSGGLGLAAVSFLVVAWQVASTQGRRARRARSALAPA